MGDDSSVIITRKGFINFMGHKVPALYAPTFSISLISVSLLTRTQGFAIYFHNKSVCFLKQLQILGFGKWDDKSNLFLYSETISRFMGVDIPARLALARGRRLPAQPSSLTPSQLGKARRRVFPSKEIDWIYHPICQSPEFAIA